jgi:hypothetical protein
MIKGRTGRTGESGRGEEGIKKEVVRTELKES